MAVRHIQKLDSLRGFAALYVVIYHCVQKFKFIPEVFKMVFFSFGQEAVMMFFLLSGFVIYWSCSRKSVFNSQNYFIRRFRRIYFPFFVSLIVSAIVFILNKKLDNNFSWFDLLGNFIMLQDISFLKPGTWFDPFLGNVVLWSLSYEWWFYILFLLAYKTIFKIQKRIYYVFVFSSISYTFYLMIPNQISLISSYFIIWWLGVEFADIFLRYHRFPLGKIKPILLSLFSMCILTAIPVFFVNKIELGLYPFLIFRHFFISFLISIVALVWYNYKMIFFDRIFGIFAAIAPISYGLYIFHYPILIQWKLSIYLDNIWLASIIKVVLLLSLSYLIEVKLQPIVNSYIALRARD